MMITVRIEVTHDHGEIEVTEASARVFGNVTADDVSKAVEQIGKRAIYRTQCAIKAKENGNG